MLSSKHGRTTMREQIQALNLEVKNSLKWGVTGLSNTPQNWPTSVYEKRNGKKPDVCPQCKFKAKVPSQIQLHHDGDEDHGPKVKRHASYYTTVEIKPMCANCHCLVHKNGKTSQDACGTWRRGPLKNMKYANPADIFSANCTDNYRLQRKYFIRWHLTGPDHYKCSECAAVTWGPDNKVLALEVHHKDGSHQNSLLTNLVLLCPNCHSAHTHQNKSLSN